MKKIWFLDIRGQLEGPYSLRDLKRDIRVTPDTLVWKEGFAHSVPIRNVPELKAVFTDDPSDIEPEESKKKIDAKQQDDLLLMEMSHEPPFLIWLLIILTLFIVAWILSNK